MDKSYQDINAETIDRWVAGGWEWGRPITHEVFGTARRGTWDVLLTPTHAAPLPVCFRAARRAAAPEPVSRRVRAEQSAPFRTGALCTQART